MKFNDSIDVLLEQLQSIKYTKREFYPRNFTLSPEFIKAFRNELGRLVHKENLPKKAAFRKLCKSLVFHL